MDFSLQNPEGLRQRCCSRASRRMVFFMRVSFVYIGLTLLSAAMVQAHTSSGQGLDTKVTIGMEDEKLDALFLKLKQHTGLSFVFDNSEIDEYPNITFETDERTVKEVLDLALKGKNLAYKLKEKTVIIYVNKSDIHKNRKMADINQEILVNEIVDFETLATITGTVKDISTQEPLAGVNIIVKGTTKGTTTNADGKYKIDASDEDILVFSFIGYTTYETQVGGRSVIEVMLEVDVTELSEVTVSTGYWEMNKRQSTGNITKVTSKEIEQQPVANPILALQGRVPGLNIQQASGVPGGTHSNFQIRGQNSVNIGANDPLVVINGVPYPTQNLSGLVGGGILPNPLNAINPLSIESIEILKDADATAIYGSLGANGVILITTKKAQAGKTIVDLNVYHGTGKISNKANLLNTGQYLQMRNEAFTNDNITPSISSAPDLLLWSPARYTDWQEELIGGTAHITNMQLSISGGTEFTKLMVSGGYFRETTVFPGDFPYQKGSLNFTGTHSSRDGKFILSFSSNLVREKNSLPSNDLTRFALSLPPNAPEPFDEDGALNWENDTWANPYANLLNSYDGLTTNQISNLDLSYRILPGLKLKGNIGYNLIKDDVTRIFPLKAARPSNNHEGQVQLSNSEVKTWVMEPQLSYSKEISKGKIEMLLGATYRETVRSGTTIEATGFNSDAEINNLSAALSTRLVGDIYTNYRYTAAFGRIGYTWNGKYLINLTGRRDGSNRFGEDNRFANFGALGAAWIFSEEKFFNQSILSFGKLRASYGITGSDQIGDYQYLSTYQSIGQPYQETVPLIPTRLGNPEYQWEKIRKLEFALELGFFKDRIFFNTCHYRNRSSNQLVEYPLPAATGFTTIISNLDAIVQNTGFEFEIMATNVDTKDFRWTSSFNFSLPQNKLVSFPNLKGSNYASRYIVGEPLRIRSLFKSNGVDPATGIYQFKDFDEDGNIASPNDLKSLFNPSTRFFGGFHNAISYKGFQLDFLFQFQKKSSISYMGYFTTPGRLSNQPVVVMSRWQNPEDHTEIQKFIRGGSASTAYSNYAMSNAAVADASFIRLKNVALSYHLQAHFINKLGMQSAKIYLLAQNLLTITNYEFLDPETFGSLPPIRMVTIGIQLTL